ncbi:MAG TPA: hypothetical protein VGM30_07630 [Puia sp.]|jgi:tetratricopeptide (TPR) repeat protein
MKSKQIFNIFILIVVLSCNNINKHNQAYVNKDDNRNSLSFKAKLFYDQNKYAEAAMLFDSLIVSDSSSGELYFKRGISHAMLLEKAKAREDFKKSIQYKYKMNHSYFNIGLSYSYENDSLALKYFENCIAVDPNFSKAYIEIMDCKQRLNEARGKSRQSPTSK